MGSVGKRVFSVCVHHLQRKPLHSQTLAMHTNMTQIQSLGVQKCLTINGIGLNLIKKRTELKDLNSVKLNFALTSRSHLNIGAIAPPSAFSVPQISYDGLLRHKSVLDLDGIVSSVRRIVEKTDPIPIRNGREVPTMEDPSVSPLVEKRAARLVVIRRRKMKKHKLKKFRKRMYHWLARIRQRREARKEKIFQDELLAQMSRSDEFDAEVWVEQFLLKATTDPQTLIPKKPKPVKPTRYVLR